MRSRSLVWLGLAAVVSVYVGFPGRVPAAEEASDAKHIAIVKVGDLPDELVERVRAHAALNLETTIRVLPALSSMGEGDLEGTVGLLEPLVTEDTFCLIALVMEPDAAKKPYVSLKPPLRIGMVNAKGLFVDDPERYARRLEKETIAAIGILAGLSHNPAPDCATYRYRDDEGLDLKGRNLCPPQLLRFRALAREADLVGHQAAPDVESDSSSTTAPPAS